jgi:hypothetical protein
MTRINNYPARRCSLFLLVYVTARFTNYIIIEKAAGTVVETDDIVISVMADDPVVVWEVLTPGVSVGHCVLDTGPTPPPPTMPPLASSGSRARPTVSPTPQSRTAAPLALVPADPGAEQSTVGEPLERQKADQKQKTDNSAKASAFPTEWQGNDKWCPQGRMVHELMFTRSDRCYLFKHITLTADRFEHHEIVCRLLSGHEGKHPRGRIYQAVMSCQGEHEQWFERADFYTPYPADALVVKTLRQASTLADLDR